MYFMCHIDYFTTYYGKEFIHLSFDPREQILTAEIDITFVQKTIMHHDFKRETVGYIVITTDPQVKEMLIKTRSRFLFYYSTDDLKLYIETAKNLLNSCYVPVIGTYSNPNVCSAGIIPIVKYKDDMLCLLGIDNHLMKYSDFGGGYDAVYIKHKIDMYKNTILKNKQIIDGHIDPMILIDHTASLAIVNEINQTNQTKQRKYFHPNHVSRIQSSIGYGDPNTLYTALRELMEETSYLDENNNTCYVFDLDMIIKKIYKERSYIYLGGDEKYRYDMYAVILNFDDLSDNLQSWVLDRYVQYTINPEKYISNRTSNLLNDNIHDDFYNIPNNNEMMGMDMIPLNCIVANTNRIDYKNYRTYKKEYNRITDSNAYHAYTYAAPILDNMRPSFADALVRYSTDFAFIAESTSFETIQNLFSLFKSKDNL